MELGLLKSHIAAFWDQMEGQGKRERGRQNEQESERVTEREREHDHLCGAGGFQVAGGFGMLGASVKCNRNFELPWRGQLKSDLSMRGCHFPSLSQPSLLCFGTGRIGSDASLEIQCFAEGQ